MSRAIVIGSGIAGMCVARVLADFFDEVVIIERDRLPDEIAPRSGVPQSRHTHVLLSRGADELECLFNGFGAKLLREGAMRFDVGTGIAVRRWLGWQTVGPTGRELFWASRELVEGTIHALLRQQTRVQIREGLRVVGLQTSDGERPRVTGIVAADEQASDQIVQADLVVDASGRNSKADDWLSALGLPVPVTRRVDAHAGYASRYYAIPPADSRPQHWWWKGVWVEGEPGRPRGAVVFPIEGDRWLMTVSGYNGVYPPTDEEGFIAYLRTLSSPIVAQIATTAKPSSSIYGNRSMANVWRAYDKWGVDLPGFIAAGDAACAFNPVYGQGMTTSVVSAGILRDVLRRQGPRGDFESEFFRAQGKFLQSVWNMAVRADFRWPQTEGERPSTPALVEAYIKLVVESGHCDSAIRRQIFPAFDLTGSPAMLFTPSCIARVLISTARRRLARRWQGAAPIPELPPLPA